MSVTETRLDRKTLAELQARNLPKMRALDILEPIKDTPETVEYVKRLDDYLAAFVNSPDDKCICCGAQQGARDPITALIGGAAFRWGLAHGEGFCHQCGYPARAHHFIGEKPDQIVLRNLILQYHPDGLSFEKQEENEE